MQRKVLSEVMTTYFPSLLLMMITYSTTFFKPFFFEAALSVNLTTMLVMTTIFISKMEGLPSTSDIKMIDCWLILCQLVPFAEVVLLTAIEYLREEKPGQKEKERGGKRKRKREKKRNRKAQQKEKQEENAGVKQDTLTSKNITEFEGSLQLVIEKDDCIKTDHPNEAWTHDQSEMIKSGLVTKLVMIGEYSTFTSNLYQFYFQRKGWCL